MPMVHTDFLDVETLSILSRISYTQLIKSFIIVQEHINIDNSIQNTFICISTYLVRI
ncbi:hypothetical protein F383_31970 [Gossypium arboreum]|uniref:Uncharacterized protein n=1 Tax=Gossypium arboreum TaxID=29729 RepID=A0A0B0PQJ1_GOSAR|nr:hypothetical protein F383_31970 [Gossypium arboreum]